MMWINKKEDVASKGKLEKPILGFKDNKKVGGIPIYIFPLVIENIMTNYDVSRIIIVRGSLYVKLLEKLGMKK